MRLLVLSVSALCVTCLGATCAIAQTGQWGQAEDQTLPYRTHVDRRHGNDHVYPDRGAVIRDVPHRGADVNYAGLSFRFAGGVWYERVGPAYIVVDPPIGLIVAQLPAVATNFDSGGKTYLYANDVFYRARPDLGGYEVVNDPEDGVPPQAQEPAAASSSRMASASPLAAPAATQSAVPGNSDTVPSATPAQAPSGDSLIPPNPTGIPIYPRNGQSADQQAMDRYQCYRFAVSQTGFDPMATNSGSSPGDVARGDSAYSRAQAACLEGRGYTVQ